MDQQQQEDLILELQRIIRGFLVRKRFYNEIRIKLQHESQSTNQLCKNVSFLRLSSIIFNVNCQQHNLIDRKSILQLTELMIRSMRSSSIQESFATLLFSANYMNSACRLIKQLTQTILRIIDESDVSKLSDARTIASFASLLHLLLNCSEENWPILKGKKDVVPIMDKLCIKILIPVAATSKNVQMLTRLIAEGLKGVRQPLNEKTIDQLFFITIRLLEIRSSNEPNEFSRGFVQLLKIPTITFILSFNTLKFAENDGHFENSIKWLTQQFSLCEFTTSESLNLVANLIHLGCKYKNAIQAKECLLDWAFLVNKLLEHCSQVENRGKKRAANAWHHPLLGWTSERIDDCSQMTFSRLHKQISSLWNYEMVQFLSTNFFATSNEFDQQNDGNGGSEKFIRKLSKSFGPNPLVNSSVERMPADFLQKFFDKIAFRTQSEGKRRGEKTSNILAIPLPPISLPIVLCQLYRNALFAFNNSRIDILSNLSRDDSLILIKLWHFVSADLTNGCNGLRTNLGYLVTDPEVAAPQFASLQLFGDIAYSLISILDEKEMYESESPFTREQLRRIAIFANRFCFHAIWDLLIDFDQNRPTQLFNSMFQLLSILYNRDCRRPFSVEPNFWTLPEISSKTFIGEFERSSPNQRAHKLMDKMPHIIQLRDRIFLFRKFIAQDKESSAFSTTIITVERTRLIEDGYRQLGGLSCQSLRGTIRVKFINQQGLDEAGIDQDGVFKEFLELTLKNIFAPELNLFKSTHDKLLFPSSTSNIQENHLDLFNFVGRMLGKAVYEGICVDVQLAPVLLASVLGKQLCPFDELASLDPLLYKNLTFVKHYSDSDDIEDLALTFSFQDEFLGKIYTHELVPGGRDLKVNNENKVTYLHLMAHYRVVKQIREQTKAFVDGFRSIVKEKWLALFSTHELQFLISGQLSDIDLDDLRKHVQYYGGLHSSHRLIRWLWSILDDEFTAEERRLFLKFVTSCSRPPLLGFAFLEPSFSIRCVETSDDLDQGDTLGSVIRGFLAINKKKQPTNERLPTASTCFNLLKLPNYTKKSILLEKLRYAIHAETGFELS